MDASSISARIKQALADKTPLAIHGGNTKAFYGGAIVGEPLDIRPYAGIIEYEPRELPSDRWHARQWLRHQPVAGYKTPNPQPK